MYGVKFFFAKLILAWRESAAIRGMDLSRHIQTLKSQGQAFLSPAKEKSQIRIAELLRKHAAKG